MSYTTPQQMSQVMTLQQLKDLTADAPVGGEYAVDWDIVQRSLNMAHGRLNGLLAKRVAVPVASPTAELCGDEQALARVDLFRRRNLENDQMLVGEKRIIEKYTLIARGDAELDGVTNVGQKVESANGAAGAKTSPWNDDNPVGP